MLDLGPGPPSKKRSLFRTYKNSRGYYFIGDQIIHLEHNENDEDEDSENSEDNEDTEDNEDNEDNEDDEIANKNLRRFYSIGNRIVFVEPDKESENSQTAKKNLRTYYSIGNRIIFLDNDDKSVSSSAFDTRTGRKRQRSASFDGESTPPLSQSLITLSSGGRSNNAAANPFVT
ncbi:uncharacterized protein F4817DRAFT_311953 [Daldinia loculata]|uniref:uncharacterized protein n=1 Tax=Daldinia loculata TaxID=103429 RepID=UPI0020C42127|nr:uncharacterized protein F4817DRAFT_311953 [Daldinia loculata]KAI1651125.1 hypothetical protein F4817DRAFT_311953 [Daldinia loculata]